MLASSRTTMNFAPFANAVMINAFAIMSVSHNPLQDRSHAEGSLDAPIRLISRGIHIGIRSKTYLT